MEVRRALVSRLSQTGWDRGRETDMGLHRPFLVGWLFVPRSKAVFRVAELGHFSPQENKSFEDRMLASDREGKEREEEI